MDSSETKSVRLPTFDGKHNTFQVWWVRFKAYATVYRFTQALKIGGESTLANQTEDSIVDKSTTAGKALGATMKRNAFWQWPT